MHDPLKDFIDHNRKAFDKEMPDNSLWEKIHQEIDGKKTKRHFTLYDIYKWSAAAAIICILLTCGYFFWIKKAYQATPLALQEKTQREIENISPEFAAQFQQINQKIRQQQVQLKQVSSGEPELYRQFSDDKALLDSTYATLKNSLQQSPNEELLIEAMLQNLRLQAELLQKQIQIISTYKNSKKTRHEKINYRDI